jgi:hypothetical protein
MSAAIEALKVLANGASEYDPNFVESDVVFL